MAIVEFKLGRKKLYRGTLNLFLGIDTMFPLVNINHETFTIHKNEESVTIFVVQGITGQVVNSFLVCEDFDPEKFSLTMHEIKLGELDFSIITGLEYDSESFKKLRTDHVIRSQWSFCI
jgi:hypothetical protein